jgi:nucleotide-binding universal stress UspA family protein
VHRQITAWKADKAPPVFQLGTSITLTDQNSGKITSSPRQARDHPPQPREVQRSPGRGSIVVLQELTVYFPLGLVYLAHWSFAMIDADDPNPPLVKSIFHPSDFSEASERAFAHALAIALLRRTAFTVFHTDATGVSVDGWGQYPAIRKTLECWGLLPEGSPRAAVFEEFGIRAEKIGVRAINTTRAIVTYLEETPADLIVLATRGSEGRPHWLDRSIAEKIARKTKSMTLFVPESSDGFVSPNSGTISLERILIAVDDDPRSNAAIAFACRAARLLGDGGVEIRLLHVGTSAFPEVDTESDPAWQFHKVRREGNVVDLIVEEAREGSADLIVMTTRGQQGFLDALRGSTTEQVLRRLSCPLLAVPAHDDGAYS